MKIFLITALFLVFLIPISSVHASSSSILGTLSWQDMEIAAEKAQVEISHTRPIEYGDYIEILKAHIEILEEEIISMGLVPVSRLKVTF